MHDKMLRTGVTDRTDSGLGLTLVFVTGAIVAGANVMYAIQNSMESVTSFLLLFFSWKREGGGGILIALCKLKS